MVSSWAELPVGRVIHLRAPSADAVGLALEPLPEGMPAVVTLHPGEGTRRADESTRRAGEGTRRANEGTGRTNEGTGRASELVDQVLEELDRVALKLFPAWLPEAEGLSGKGVGELAAARALAAGKAARTVHFGPFLADLAGRAVSGGRGQHRFSRELRAAELAKVVAASYGRRGIGLLVDGATDDPVLTAAAQWLAGHGRFGVWLVSPGANRSERMATVEIELPGYVKQLVESVPKATDRPLLSFPPVQGKPHFNSVAEQRLERELCRREWARGRRWNMPYLPGRRYIVDLMWWDERCAVEIDGDEHRQPLQFAKDRQRDVVLQTDGFAVLRFTNDQVLTKLDLVLAQIQEFLARRRTSR